MSHSIHKYSKTVQCVVKDLELKLVKAPIYMVVFASQKFQILAENHGL